MSSSSLRFVFTIAFRLLPLIIVHLSSDAAYPGNYTHTNNTAPRLTGTVPIQSTTITTSSPEHTFIHSRRRGYIQLTSLTACKNPSCWHRNPLSDIPAVLLSTNRCTLSQPRPPAHLQASTIGNCLGARDAGADRHTDATTMSSTPVILQATAKHTSTVSGVRIVSPKARPISVFN